MSMIQIRNVPDSLHRRLKARAAMSGLSLSDMLLREISVVADTPTFDELRARLDALGPISEDLDNVGAIRAERDSR